MTHSSAFNLATIVEGDGEVLALPVLLRLIRPEWKFSYPIRVRRQAIMRAGYLEKYLSLAMAAIQETSTEGGVLVLLDSDDDCPAKLGPDLLRRASAHTRGVPVQVVLAKRCFESWLLAGAAVTPATARP